MLLLYDGSESWDPGDQNYLTGLSSPSRSHFQIIPFDPVWVGRPPACNAASVAGPLLDGHLSLVGQVSTTGERLGAT